MSLVGWENWEETNIGDFMVWEKDSDLLCLQNPHQELFHAGTDTLNRKEIIDFVLVLWITWERGERPPEGKNNYIRELVLSLRPTLIKHDNVSNIEVCIGEAARGMD